MEWLNVILKSPVSVDRGNPNTDTKTENAEVVIVLKTK